MVDIAVNAAKPENVAVLATSADQFAINTPGAWNLGNAPDRNLKGYTYTDRPVYRPGDTVHFKTIVRAQTATGYSVPQGQELSLEMRDPQTYDVMWTQTVKLSDMGTANWNYAIPADAKLGSYYLSMQMGERYVEGTNFSVEDYKKPEYAVKVTAQTPRVLEGQPIKATIDARYYFGEPVANAKVKWVVHTSTYWPMGRDEDEEQFAAGGGEGDEGGDNADAENDDSYGGDQETEQSGTLDADGKLADHGADTRRQQEAGPGLSHRSARDRCGQSRNRRARLRARDLRQLLPDGRAELLRLQQGQHRDRHRHRAGLRQEAGADFVPSRDESLGLAQRCGPGCHHDAGPDRRQRQSADQADDSRLRRISRARNRDHAREARHRDHSLSMGAGRKSLVERPRAGARADRPRQEDLSAGRHRACADRDRQRADLGAGDGRGQRTLLRTGDQEQRRQHHGRRADQGRSTRPTFMLRPSSFAATSSIKDRRA